MRLGIDARDVFAPEPRGVGKTLRELIGRLLSSVSDWDISLFTNRVNGVKFPSPAKIEHIDIPGDRFNLWEKVRLPVAAWKGNLDVLHCPSQTAPSLAPCPVVLTVHDLIPLKINDGWKKAEVSRFRRALGDSVAKAKRIITVSEFTKRDLLSEFPVDENKVDVIHWGVSRYDHNELFQTQWELLAAQHGFAAPYFVAFGGDAPRKNLERIVRAFASLVCQAGSEVRLVLVGVPLGVKGRYRMLCQELGIADQVVQMSFLKDQEIGVLLAHSAALVYPSLYEGFGLPIVEAMAAGAPVITSDRGSMAEVAGEAAILVDPENPAAIGDAMRECLMNSPLKEALRGKGYARIRQFRWDNVAAQTLTTYRKALE